MEKPERMMMMMMMVMTGGMLLVVWRKTNKQKRQMGEKRKTNRKMKRKKEVKFVQEGDGEKKRHPIQNGVLYGCPKFINSTVTSLPLRRRRMERDLDPPAGERRTQRVPLLRCYSSAAPSPPAALLSRRITCGSC